MKPNERNLPNAESRGQVGIGTLIVFIAMVLVAAIAAGVLINTAGFLQSKGEATGQESTSQVTNRLKVTGVTGEVYSGPSDKDARVGKVDVTVTQAPGAENIDLETVTVQWVGPSGTYNINHKSASTTADAEFATSPIKDSDDSSPVVNDPDDRITMTFDIGKDDDSGTTSADINDGGTPGHTDRLDPGSTVELRLSTQSGGSVTTTLVVPESLEGKSAVTL
jgi:flagellin FlaB